MNAKESICPCLDPVPNSTLFVFFLRLFVLLVLLDLFVLLVFVLCAVCTPTFVFCVFFVFGLCCGHTDSDCPHALKHADRVQLTDYGLQADYGLEAD